MVIVLDGTLLALSIVEVQSRYQIAWYLPMVALAALAMSRYNPEPPKRTTDQADTDKFD